MAPMAGRGELKIRIRVQDKLKLEYLAQLESRSLIGQLAVVLNEALAKRDIPNTFEEDTDDDR